VVPRVGLDTAEKINSLASAENRTPIPRSSIPISIQTKLQTVTLLLFIYLSIYLFADLFDDSLSTAFFRMQNSSTQAKGGRMSIARV
jgi:hypothetical protein